MVGLLWPLQNVFPSSDGKRRHCLHSSQRQTRGWTIRKQPHQPANEERLLHRHVSCGGSEVLMEAAVCGGAGGAAWWSSGIITKAGFCSADMGFHFWGLSYSPAEHGLSSCHSAKQHLRSTTNVTCLFSVELTADFMTQH